MIKLFYTTINNLTGDYALADWQHKKAAVYRKSEDYLRSTAASLLLNAVLFNGRPAPTPLLGQHGKPYFQDKPHFNISHAGDFAVLAVASLPVGIDIEQKMPEDYLALGKVFLCPDEYERLLQTADKGALFYDLWTRKESYLKMTGTGLQQDPKSFSVLQPLPNGHFFVRELSAGYVVTICSLAKKCAQNFTLLDF